jgi:hypothetical protein
MTRQSLLLVTRDGSLLQEVVSYTVDMEALIVVHEVVFDTTKSLSYATN